MSDRLEEVREEGLAGIGIADLMKEAGLTVGGSTSTSNRMMTSGGSGRSALGALEKVPRKVACSLDYCRCRCHRVLAPYRTSSFRARS